MKPSYNIILNSKNGLNQLSIASGYTANDVLITESNNVYFPFVHWDRMLPEGKYKLTWTYTGSGNIIKQNNVAKIRMIGFRNDNTYNTTNNNGTESNVLDLGILKSKYILDNDQNANTNVSCLNAILIDNEPIILERRPNNGPLTIQILDEQNNLWYDDIGRQLAGTISHSANTPIIGLRNIQTSARVIIGSPIWYNSGNSKYNKILDMDTNSFGNSTGLLDVVANYPSLTIGFATGGIVNRIDPSNPPGHYILQLYFELL